MLVALEKPQLVDRLVVVDVAPTSAPGRGETEDLVQTLKDLDVSALKNRREADAIIQHQIPVRNTCIVLLCAMRELHAVVSERTGSRLSSCELDPYTPEQRDGLAIQSHCNCRQH